MPNENNLIPFSERSVSEARECGAKGGKKSGETRRRKRDMKSKMKMILDLPVSEYEDFNQLTSLGLDVEDIDNETLMLAGLFKKAKNGDVFAIREIRNILGKDNDTERVKLQKKQLTLQEKKLSGETEPELEDDGFIAALNGSAASDWSEPDEA